MWALRYIEEQLRQHRNEPFQISPSTIGLVRARVNKFIGFLHGKPTLGMLMMDASRVPGYDAKISRRGAAEMPVDEPHSLEEALERSKRCGCTARKSDGFKGCAKMSCMGAYFELYRLKRRRF